MMRTSDVRTTVARIRSSTFRGPLASIFRNPVARVLDQARIVGNMEQTISMLSNSTRLDYKTVKTVLRHLIGLGFVQETRRIGNAQAYRFNVENELHGLLNWANESERRKNKGRSLSRM